MKDAAAAAANAMVNAFGPRDNHAPAATAAEEFDADNDNDRGGSTLATMAGSFTKECVFMCHVHIESWVSKSGLFNDSAKNKATVLNDLDSKKRYIL